MGDELDEFPLSFMHRIGFQSYQKIATIHRENDFTSRLSLELLDSDMFATSSLFNHLPTMMFLTSIGIMLCLAYTINEFISVLQY